MKAMLAVIFALSLNLAAQSPATAAPPAAPEPAQAEPAKPADLATTLTEAEAAANATNTDLANLRTDKWSSGWKTGWTKKSSHKQQASQTADSLKALSAQLPQLIADVRNAHGSVGSAFKLYNHLTQVCEGLDSLVDATQSYGKKEEYTRLSADYTNLMRIRTNLSAYVEQRAAVVDPKGNVPHVVAASENKKSAESRKDDAPPAKKTVAKRAARKKRVTHSAKTSALHEGP